MRAHLLLGSFHLFLAFLFRLFFFCSSSLPFIFSYRLLFLFHFSFLSVLPLYLFSLYLVGLLFDHEFASACFPLSAFSPADQLSGLLFLPFFPSFFLPSFLPPFPSLPERKNATMTPIHGRMPPSFCCYFSGRFDGGAWPLDWSRLLLVSRSCSLSLLADTCFVRNHAFDSAAMGSDKLRALQQTRHQYPEQLTNPTLLS